MKVSGDPTPFKLHKQAGFDKSQGRFRDIEGKRISKLAFSQLKETYDTGLHTVTPPNSVSAQMEHLEDVIGSGGIMDKGRVFDAFSKKPTKAWPIPQDILAAMRLSEYFYRTEGDISFALSIPREILFANDFEIQSPNAEIKKDFDELYDQDQMDIFALMKDAYDCESVYGNCYPLLIPSGKNDSPLGGVTLLNPKYMYCGSPIAYDAIGTSGPNTNTQNESGFTSTFGLLSQTEKAWDEASLRNEVHPMAYNAFGPQWNEQVTRGLWIDLDPKYMHPIQINKQRWERYATPILSRAFRAITNRKMFEELRRSTAEGFKSQLLIFNVGTPDIPGSVEEMAIYNGLLNSLAPERTGMLLARGNLKAEVAHIDSLDKLMATETWKELTLAIFRNIGVNMQFVAGESPNQRQASGQEDIDVQIFIERMSFKQKVFARWERWFRLTMAEMLHPPGTPGSDKYMADMRKTTLKFQKPMLEMASNIKNYLLPLFSIGVISIKTMHEKSQLNHDVEVANRTTEEKTGQDQLFMPRATFVQQAVTPDGTSTTGQGKEPSNAPKNPAKASTEAEVPDYADFLLEY
jgi:hypothetical protein